MQTPLWQLSVRGLTSRLKLEVSPECRTARFTPKLGERHYPQHQHVYTLPGNKCPMPFHCTWKLPRLTSACSRSIFLSKVGELQAICRGCFRLWVWLPIVGRQRPTSESSPIIFIPFDEVVRHSMRYERQWSETSPESQRSLTLLLACPQTIQDAVHLRQGHSKNGESVVIMHFERNRWRTTDPR